MTTTAARQRSRSRSRPPAQPTTPLRPPSRSSLHASTSHPSHTFQSCGSATGSTSSADGFHLSALEPSFAELSDSLSDLEANMMHLQLLHESTTRFSDDFAAFLYGLNMSAFCVDFPEAPGAEAFRRYASRLNQGDAGDGSSMDGERDAKGGSGQGRRAARARGEDVDATFLTTDTSFVNDPPPSVKAPRFVPPAQQAQRGAGTTRGSVGAGRGVGRGRGGIPTRGGKGTVTGNVRGGAIGRGVGRGVR